MRGRRLRSRCAVLRLVLSVCAGTCVLPPCITWLLTFHIQVERTYLLDLNVRQLFCNGTSPHNTPVQFFKTCDANVDAILQQPFRLVTNFTCREAVSEEGDSASQQSRTLSVEEGESNNTCNGHFIVPNTSPVISVPFRNTCLKRFITDNCFDGLPVPKVVHFVWFSNHTMDLVTFLSVLAAHRFLDPCLILFHADVLPVGPYWRALLSLVPVLVHVQRSAPSKVFGRTLGAVQHKSDIARLEALKEYGGIYLDGDQIVVRSLDEFRDKQFVMGHENVHNLANSLLISVPGAPFIDRWYRNYRSYNPRQWGIHSTFLPLALARIYPKLIHNAGYAFVKPDLPGVHDVWAGHYDWSQNHAVHLYYRSMVEGGQVRTNYTLSELMRLNSTLGEIARHIVFGSKDACKTL